MLFSAKKVCKVMGKVIFVLRQRKETFLTGRNGVSIYQGVEVLDKPCLGFSVCTWYQEQASQPTQRAAEDGCGAISILIWQPKLIPHGYEQTISCQEGDSRRRNG